MCFPRIIKNHSADCSHRAAAPEEDVSKAGWHSVDAPNFGLEGSESGCRAHVAEHLEVNRDELIDIVGLIFGVGEGLLGCGGQRKVGLRLRVGIRAVVKGLVVPLRAVLSSLCPAC